MTAIISKESVHRLLSDIRGIMQNPLDDNGIYYIHDETDILRGWAMIVGPPDTPYFGGLYFFKLQFPTDYPYSPPIVTCHTNDGHTRFNPNLYVNGKVCLSILNTWRGEPWSACQTISTVLLTLCTVFCDNPIINEPGITVNCPDCGPYNEILRYANIKVAICDMVDKSRASSDKITNIFSTVIETVLEQKYNTVLLFLEKMKDVSPYPMATRIYGMRELIDYPCLYARFINIKLK
jgi:ubiquitin-protein ligase